MNDIEKRLTQAIKKHAFDTAEVPYSKLIDSALLAGAYIGYSLAMEDVQEINSDLEDKYFLMEMGFV